MAKRSVTAEQIRAEIQMRMKAFGHADFSVPEVLRMIPESPGQPNRTIHTAGIPNPHLISLKFAIRYVMDGLNLSD